jgi:two-component system chemotaxis sensor kinase CheA
VDQTQREFLVEIEELVEQIFGDLADLRDTRVDGRPRRQSVDRIFRRVHSVKGLASSCGLAAVNHIAHEFENVLDAIRAGRVAVSDNVLDTCDCAADAVAESLSLAAAGIVEPSRRALFDRLKAAAAGENKEPSRTAEALVAPVPFEIWQALSGSEKQHLNSIVEENIPVFIVTTNFAIANFDEEFSRLKQKLMEHGEVISTSPTVAKDHADRVSFRVLYASKASTQELQTSVNGFPDVAFNKVSNGGSTQHADLQGRPGPVPAFVSASSLSNFVHTDLDKLDGLISSTHELFRTTAKALDLALSQKEITTTGRAELQNLYAQIRSSFLGVEDELINLRMVSLGPTLQRATRAGRAAARSAAREIDFEIAGIDLQIDKLLAEAIVDPLIHLVRNAVDHGIESAAERIKAGKKKRGTIRIEAMNEGSQSRVRVTDDGRGIDANLISAAAARLGIVQGAGLDLERSLRLIFRPGFTTFAAASEVSGRGVGLDVVETAVEQVGGELRVSSKPGVGTSFEIRLPVTFGLLRATVVVSAKNRYCIPSSQTVVIEPLAAGNDLENRVAFNPPQPHEDQKSETNESSADQLPLVSLRALLGEHEEPQGEDEGSSRQSYVVTCQFPDEEADASGSGTKRVGLIVDAVEGTQEVLVRNLGRHAGRWYGVAGATELQDGTVALVLDIPRLLSRTGSGFHYAQ